MDFPDENDFDIFLGSAWGDCIVASKELACTLYQNCGATMNQEDQI